MPAALQVQQLWADFGPSRGQIGSPQSIRYRSQRLQLTISAPKALEPALKPGNLFVVPDSEAPSGERVKILDFGIAKFFGTEEGASPAGEEPRHLTTVGKLLGTPVYMSPEQCSGSDQINDRVDVYALGIILYQMIAGRLPFEAAAACVVMTKHLMEPPPPLGAAAPDAPPEVLTLVHQMLAKNGPERPPMAQVTTRLEELLAAQQGLGTGEWRSLHGQVKQRVRRPIGLAVWLVAGFVLTSSGLLGVGLYRRAHRPLPRMVAGSAAAGPRLGVAAVNPANTAPLPQARPATAPSATVPAPGPQLAAALSPKPTGEIPDDTTRVRRRPPPRGSRKPAGTTPSAGGKSPGSDAAPDIPVFR